MPFGQANAPSSIQKYINGTWKEYLDKISTAYIDHVLTFSLTLKEH